MVLVVAEATQREQAALAARVFADQAVVVAAEAAPLAVLVVLAAQAFSVSRLFATGFDMNYAIIRNSVVVNIVIWDHEQWVPPEGTQAVAILPNEWCSIGYSYDPNASPRFVAPPIPPE
jgi:hypothetical protein